MMNDLFEQFQTASKPLSDLVSFSTESTGQLLKKQGEFLGEVVTDTYTFSKDVMVQRDLTAITDLQKRYLETMQEKATANGKELYGELTEIQEKSADLVKEMFTKASETATEAVNKVANSANA